MSDGVYDIQSQIKKTNEVKNYEPPTGHSSVDFDIYSTAAAGEGSSTIPATAPTLQDPMIPGKTLTTQQRKDIDGGSTIRKDPLNMAIDANAQALKDAGIITKSQADVNEETRGEGVLFAVPGSK